jgi:CheY-like chemotaxis protein
MPDSPSIIDNRRHLEETWRLRLQRAQEQYQAACSLHGKVQQESSEGATDQSSLYCARSAESQTLAEYARVLRIFIDLTLHGKLPEEHLAEPESAPRLMAPPPMEVSLISIVDDDESIRDSIRTLLRSVGYHVRSFESAELFLESGALAQTECLILDVRMPGMDGLELQRRLGTRIPIIFVAAHDDGTTRKRAALAGAIDFLCKPFNPSALIATVEAALVGRRECHLRTSAC